MSKKYKRILLKLSGEQLAGKFDVGIDPEVVTFLANEIKPVLETGCQVVLVAGGGNMVRGAKMAGNGINRVTADQMGMLSGLMNAMATTDIFEHNGIRTRCLSNIFADQVAESYSYRRARKHLEHGRVVIVAGGLARPYFTHDTAAVSIGLELDCEAVIKATKVEGVYTKDPAKYPDAKLLQGVTYQQALDNPEIKVMDKAAVGLAMEQNMPVIIYDSTKKANLLKIVNGEDIGTLIKN